MCNMLSFWLTLSLLTLILHKLESAMFIPCTLAFNNKIISRILPFRVQHYLSTNRSNTSLNTSLSPCNRSNPPLSPCNRSNTRLFHTSNTLNTSLSPSNRINTNVFNKSEVPLTNLNPKIPKHFEEKIAKRLDTNTSNPLGIVAHLIRDFFNSYEDPVISRRKFQYFPVQFRPVTITENFDELQVPLDHVSRDPKDSYYLDQDYVNTFKEKSKLYTEVINSKNAIFDRDMINLMGKKFKHSEYKLLPTHTTSYITKLLREGVTQAIYSGQVFRRDEIDSEHYPVFHQMDGYLLFTRQDIENLRKIEEFNCKSTDEVIFRHLKRTLENLVSHLFQFVTTTKLSDPMVRLEDMVKYWDDDATFPFTFPSSEYYLKNSEQPTELLGCGVLKNVILKNNFTNFTDKYGNNNLGDNSVDKNFTSNCTVDNVVDNLDSLVDQSENVRYIGGWAFGIGLERLSMVLCRIFDIRQFWETDERFLKQYENSFSQKKLPIFVKYSKNPPVVRDMSFYIPDTFDEELFREIILEKGKGYVEDIQFISTYFNEKISKKSFCYRVVYRAFEENLTNSFVNSIHQETVKSLQNQLNLTIR